MVWKTLFLTYQIGISAVFNKIEIVVFEFGDIQRNFDELWPFCDLGFARRHIHFSEFWFFFSFVFLLLFFLGRGSFVIFGFRFFVCLFVICFVLALLLLFCFLPVCFLPVCLLLFVVVVLGGFFALFFAFLKGLSYSI